MRVLALLFVFIANWAVAQVPGTCAKFQWQLTREVQKALGPAAPVSVFSAQVMQESSCNPAARSKVGALGLTQFMPATASWVPDLNSELAPPNPLDPAWAIKAQVTFMKWLLRRNPGETQCDNYAFALSAYNGGEGWLRRDQAVAASLGLNKLKWFGSVEASPDRRRHPSAIAENRGYPRRILLLLTPRFVAAGWGAGVDCGGVR